MSDTRTMVYYLPASEHKMLKSPLARPLQQGSYRTASESAFPSFTNFLRGTEDPTLHVGQSISSPTDGALNVVVRSLNWQTPRNFRGARRAHRSHSWHSSIRSRRSELCGIWSRGCSYTAYSFRPHWYSAHCANQLGHHRPAGHRLRLLPADHRRLPPRRRQLHGRVREPRRERRPASCRGADDRLHPQRGRRHLRGGGRTGLRLPSARTPHAPALPRP